VPAFSREYAGMFQVAVKAVSNCYAMQVRFLNAVRRVKSMHA
jgi:hypothetical protein